MVHSFFIQQKIEYCFNLNILVIQYLFIDNDIMFDVCTTKILISVPPVLLVPKI